MSRELNPQALILEDAQTEIRIIVQRGYFSGKSIATLQKDVSIIVSKALKAITSPTLRQDAKKSLMHFARRIFNELRRKLGFDGVAALYAIKVAQGLQLPIRLKPLPFDYPTDEKGVPLQEYSKDYLKKVNKVIRELADMNAIDPNDIRGLNSLRNLAEMQVRYEANIKQIDDFRARGVKIVVCSVHADCSDRCFDFQGKVFSLDNTAGFTKDGRSYFPLEVATDIYYTTKAGRTYKNGLLGFNCRHSLSEYRPYMAIPNVSREEQQKESKINNRQRELERRVRIYRERAVALRDIDRAAFSKARRQAIAANKEYKAFSHANGRAYYPDRVKIIT